jgi:glycine oxidase
MSAPHRVAIVGAGVMGLSIGWRLAQAGCRVAVFDRGAAGRGASWAAAGMLAAGIEAEPGEEALYALNRRSQQLWPSFAAELQAATGIDVGLRREGTIWAALTRDDAAQLRFHHDFQCKLGIHLEWLSGAEARRREPYLHPSIAAAVFSPDDHQVDNRLLVQALAVAFTHAGGELHENRAVTRLDVTGGRVTGLRLDDAPVLGPSGVEGLVLATGHHRNGILLTPVTAEAVGRTILTGVTDPAISGFSLSRFHDVPSSRSAAILAETNRC